MFFVHDFFGTFQDKIWIYLDMIFYIGFLGRFYGHESQGWWVAENWISSQFVNPDELWKKTRLKELFRVYVGDDIQSPVMWGLFDKPWSKDPGSLFNSQYLEDHPSS